MAKFIKTFEQPDAIITAFANDLGYQEKITNPAYKGSLDPDTQEVIGNGEPELIDNPYSREMLVSDEHDILTANWLLQFAEKNAQRASNQKIKDGIKIQHTALKQGINTVIE